MTLKEELEILRGEPIDLRIPASEVPCIETSDSKRLCKHPVVSVHMITYNHEPYIRQAIEGVMMQKTDFEFELVIGEDASTDKTREICFEYQKRYPDKIRVLWSEYNVNHIGGNSTRVLARCRGEFIAFCEGDDYWIDPLKLQKQVDVMRKYPNVSLCFAGAKIYHGKEDRWSDWDGDRTGFEPGVIPRKRYLLRTMFGKDPRKAGGSEIFVMTATLLFRRSLLEDARSEYDIFTWRLFVGDSVFCLGLGSLGDVYYLADQVSVYRQMPTGVTCSRTNRCWADTMLVRVYYAKVIFGLGFPDMPMRWKDALCQALLGCVRTCPFPQKNYMQKCLSTPSGRKLYLNIRLLPTVLFLLLGRLSEYWYFRCLFWQKKVLKNNSVPKKLLRFYEESNDA